MLGKRPVYTTRILHRRKLHVFISICFTCHFSSYLSRMSLRDNDNKWFRLASALVNNSDRHVFLTGKAGTGKTTFLKHIQETTFKKSAVVAPTGVAAINAGGVTMHSFFQLPFGPYVPVQAGWNSQASDSGSLFKQIRFNKAKRDLLNELELLIIDEVSMVRADMLDAVDAICRHFRKRPDLPFGGLQVLYIGDLFQLPPVVNDEEWKNILSLHYKSPFFFDAQVLRDAPPLVVELKKIYRQDEEAFIHILNQIRNNQVNEADLDRLHEHFDRSFEPAYGDTYITLTTHNNKADQINQQQLQRLRGDLEQFQAEVEGEFGEKSFPADKNLQLKIGAQVMFLKNDKGDRRRFYNGKLATVNRIEPDAIYVSTGDEPDDIKVERETWTNIRYNYDRMADKVEEEQLGSFKQFPLRLAWAITIHKSQGLTFEKAIIDAGSSFAAGQVYVALSRLTSMKGLVLFSRIHPNAIHTDERVLAFVNKEMDEEEMEKLVEEEQKRFVEQSLIGFFQWDKLTSLVAEFVEAYDDRQIPDKEWALQWARTFFLKIVEQQQVGAKFARQLEDLIHADPVDYAFLKSRTEAAVNYFDPILYQLTANLQEHIDAVKIKKKVKKYTNELREIKTLLQRKQYQLKKAGALASGLAEQQATAQLIDLIEGKKLIATSKTGTPQPEPEPVPEEDKKARPQKGDSARISLAMFQEGKDIKTIASERGYAWSTIESHLASFLDTGEVTVNDIVTPEKQERIRAVLKEMGENITGTKEVKDRLPVEYTYAEIKAVLWDRGSRVRD